MIRPIDIRLNAAHPELPLAEAVTFTGSPSTVLIRGVPPNCGRWAITAVFVAASFPDGSTTTRAAVQSANGVWVATLPATATSGRTANGIRVMADGIDENGDAVTGYILGVADFAVASLDVTPAPEPGETSYQMLYFDAVPSVLHKGDVTTIDGVLKFYNGTAWEPFAAPVTLDDAVTPTSANGVKSSGIWSAIWGALSALPTGFTSLYDWCVAQLAGKASTADATLTPIYSQAPTFSEWAVVTTPDTSGYTVSWEGADTGSWVVIKPNGGKINTGNTDINAISLATVVDFATGVEITATRTRTDILGYQLGSQSDKPLASEAEAEALKTELAGKVPTSRTVNGKALTGDVTLTGADIAVSGTDATKVNAAINTATLMAAAAENKANLAIATIPYTLVTKSISNNAVTLDDRASNAVTISATLSPNTLTINFPTATSGKARDFGLRLTVASGITTAPELALPQGVTCENADGEAPEIGADGAATILYFTETASGVFLVKGEVVTAIS